MHKRKVLIGIFGTGGCGRGVMPIARENFRDDETATLVFVDDNPQSTTINGHPVLTPDAFLQYESDERKISLAVANPQIRQNIYNRFSSENVEFLNLFSRHSIQMDDVSIEDGAIVSPFVTITSNIRIGKQFHANLYSYVEHDCLIGDFVTFAPSVRCNGNVHIGDGAYIGAGAVIRQGAPGRPLVIGAGAVIGMGAVVTRDVPPRTTVVGNPARTMQREA